MLFPHLINFLGQMLKSAETLILVLFWGEKGEEHPLPKKDTLAFRAEMKKFSFLTWLTKGPNQCFFLSNVAYRPTVYETWIGLMCTSSLGVSRFCIFPSFFKTLSWNGGYSQENKL